MPRKSLHVSQDSTDITITKKTPRENNETIELDNTVVKKIPRVKKEADISSPEDGTIITTSKKPKELANRETITAGFDELINMIDSEIKELRDGQIRKSDVKFLRSLNKHIKSLKVQCERAIKKKSTTPHQNNHNSGFQKPVRISNELAKFTGWPADELRSRVDVTKYICDYIAANKLQNPEDKRQILPDAKLQKLLGFNPDKADKPLCYYGIQTYLKNQNHFPKDTN
jgi:chromatin remodeling complex protein RSC6